MISAHYMAKTLREHGVLFVFAFVMIGLFQVLILTLVIEVNLLGMAEMFMRQLPPQIQRVLGDQIMAQFSVNGAVAFGYMHPMVLTLSIIVAIVLPGRHVAGEIEKGTLELLFSLPIKRSAVVLSLWVFSGMALLGLVIGGWMGSGVGLWLFPEARSVPIVGIAKAGLNLWLLMFAISSYTLLISAYAREGGQATLRAAGLTLFFFFLNTIAIFWPTIDFLGMFSIFYYHKPQLVMMDASVLGRNVAVLVGVILVCGTLAIRQVNRRDIPG